MYMCVYIYQCVYIDVYIIVSIYLDTWIFFFISRFLLLIPGLSFKKEFVLGDLEVGREMGALIH